MPDTYMSSNVKCPFYIVESEKYKKIVCEGIEQGWTITMRFKDEAKKPWMLKYCCADYESCPICKLAMRKYE